MIEAPAHPSTSGGTAHTVPPADSYVALMYHNISPDPHRHAALSPSHTAYFVGSDVFARQLEELSHHRCLSPDSLAGFYASSAQPAQGSQHHVLLTFDDGWSDCVDAGGALLAQYGLKALLFVTTDFLDRSHFLSRSALARVSSDHFCIGSHARSHRMLCLLDDAEIRAELSDSKKILEDILGRPVDTISIPNGAVDARVRRIASECGYAFVFDSEIRINRRRASPLAIGRIAIKQNTTSSQFTRYLNGRIGAERLRRTVLEAPKRLLGLKRYDQLRRRLLGEQPAQVQEHPSSL